MNYMRRAVTLASQALGSTSPNPAVGAVVVKDGEIVGEGFTQPPGGDHAEVVAIKQAGSFANGATLYVTLETVQTISDAHRHVPTRLSPRAYPPSMLRSVIQTLT